MKLTINRTEKQEGLIFKKTVYYLDTTLELTPEEQALAKKHGWDKENLAEGTYSNGYSCAWKVKEMLGNKNYNFATLEHLAYFEDKLITNAKQLKANLEAIKGGFTSAGPQEIEL